MATSHQDPGSGPPVAVLTGATAGIGRATAEALARQGFRLVLVGRDPGRLSAAAQALAAIGAATVETVSADLSVQGDIRRAGDEIGARHPGLDVLINNAGAMFGRRVLTADGVESTFAVNHLAYVLMTRCLEGPLRAAGGRVVWVASGAHRRVRSAGDWQSTRGYRPIAAYCRSKLANVMAGYAYARRLAGSGVTLNTLHPGFVRTDIGTANRGVPRLAWRLLMPFALTPEAGARTSVHLATDPAVAGVTGRYFDRCRPASSSPIAGDAAAQEALWRLCGELIGEDLG